MLKNINTTQEILKNTGQIKYEPITLKTNNIILSKLIIKDMLYYMKIWRQIRGYSSNGQRSHSNNKGNKKNKLISKFRLQQFYKLFGRKKRDIFPTLILAEYNNRLWFLIWRGEWYQGRYFLLTLAMKNQHKVSFDPQLLAKNIVTGLTKKKKKKKHNTAKKKILMVVTIGLPILFSLYFYNYQDSYKLPFTLMIPDESRRKMGKKKKIKKIKKK